METSNLKSSSIKTILNTLYYNQEKGECYINSELSECDFSTIGLGEDARKKIDIQTINNELTSTTSEIEERNNITTIVESNFEDYITLITLKDYTKTFNCEEEKCETTSWLTKENMLISTLNKTEENTFSISINEDGTLKTNNLLAKDLEIVPVVKLKENIHIIKGEGTKDNPYILE